MATGVDSGETVEAEREKVVRLFKFLAELAQLGLTPVNTIDQYNQALPVNEVVPDIEKIGTPQDADWFTVQRVRLPPRPDVPEILERWLLDVELDDWQELPRPLNEIAELVNDVDDDGSRVSFISTLQFLDFPEPMAAWTEFEKDWKTWAERRQALDPKWQAYEKLFSMHGRALELGEQFEVFLGVGLLSWRTEKKIIQRHLVTAAVELDLDDKTGAISVRPDQISGRGTCLEQDMVPAQLRPPPERVESIEQAIAEADGPFDVEPISDALRSWVLTASADGQYDSTWEKPQPTHAPLVTQTPMLCLRKRTFRDLEATYANIIEQLEGSVEIRGLC